MLSEGETYLISSPAWWFKIARARGAKGEI